MANSVVRQSEFDNCTRNIKTAATKKVTRIELRHFAVWWDYFYYTGFLLFNAIVVLTKIANMATKTMIDIKMSDSSKTKPERL